MGWDATEHGVPFKRVGLQNLLNFCDEYNVIEHLLVETKGLKVARVFESFKVAAETEYLEGV